MCKIHTISYESNLRNNKTTDYKMSLKSMSVFVSVINTWNCFFLFVVAFFLLIFVPLLLQCMISNVLVNDKNPLRIHYVQLQQKKNFFFFQLENKFHASCCCCYSLMSSHVWLPFTLFGAEEPGLFLVSL